MVWGLSFSGFVALEAFSSQTLVTDMCCGVLGLQHTMQPEGDALHP